MAKVEVFSAGCPICDQGVRLVREVAGQGHEVIVHNLREDARAADRASAYGVKTVPAVVVDGSLVPCCQNTGPRREELTAALT
jgi:glutaredoxin